MNNHVDQDATPQPIHHLSTNNSNEIPGVTTRPVFSPIQLRRDNADTDLDLERRSYSAPLAFINESHPFFSSSEERPSSKRRRSDTSRSSSRSQNSNSTTTSGHSSFSNTTKRIVK